MREPLTSDSNAAAYHWFQGHGHPGSDMGGILSDDRVSPVDRQRRTRDVAGIVAAQPDGNSRDLDGLGAAEHRGPVDARGRQFPWGSIDRCGHRPD